MSAKPIAVADVVMEVLARIGEGFRPHRDTALLVRHLGEAQRSIDQLHDLAVCGDALQAYLDGTAALSLAQSIIEGNHQADATMSQEATSLLETIVCDQPVAAQQRAAIAATQNKQAEQTIAKTVHGDHK